MYRTPQNTFLEDLKFLKLKMFLPAGNHGVSILKCQFQKMVSPKKFWIWPQ